MFRVNRKFAFVVALAAALVMLFVLSSTAFAGSPTTVCVDGYVINHREVAVNGLLTQPPLIVEAYDSNNVLVDSAPVGSNGYFKFAALPVGIYDFRLDLPLDWEGIVPTAPNDGVAATGLTDLKEKKDCYRIVFKVRRVFGVVVIKWEELLDGTVRPGVGWVITATPQGDPFVHTQTATTNANGQAEFTLTAGHWVIHESLQSGWTPITPSSVTLNLDQYAPAGATYPVIFKNRQPPCKGKIVVLKLGFGVDAAGNAVQLGPMAGWAMKVKRGTWQSTRITDGSGKAIFPNLPPGVYTVSEQVQVGWAAMSANPQTVVHRDCEETQVIFENKEVKGDLKISGRKLFKAWVPPYQGTLVGLSGWAITATLVGSNPLNQLTTLTDALGNYVFTAAQLETAGIGFPGATIEVCEENRTNWIHMSPKCVTITFPYPVPPNYSGAVVNFTNVQDPPVAGAAATTSQAAGCRASFVVPKGQTLARLAAQHDTSVSALVKANRIKNADLIYAGQRLCIPVQ